MLDRSYKHPIFYQPNTLSCNASNSWIAVSLISHYYLIKNNIHQPNKNQSEKMAVRLLLEDLLDYLDISDTLVEDSFPYYLKNTRYFVCFTHSTNSVAVILSKNPSSIDLENRNVPLKVAKRYFHNNELYKITQYPDDLAQILINELWRIKECIIKIDIGSLISGIKTDLSFLIPYLTNFQSQKFNIDLSTLNPYLSNVINDYNVKNLWMDRTYQISAIC